jgi:hypothetical protein
MDPIKPVGDSLLALSHPERVEGHSLFSSPGSSQLPVPLTLNWLPAEDRFTHFFRFLHEIQTQWKLNIN